ncbi:hypothetical protein HLV35_07400 [Eggerthellaceae bacterium zg-997]|nr:hypothetical protein [Eggerthellaceae bacterium zg-997]
MSDAIPSVLRAAPVFMTFADIKAQMGVDRKTLYGWARDEEDPLPMRYPMGARRGAVALSSEVSEWFLRNSRPFGEVRAKAARGGGDR